MKLSIQQRRFFLNEFRSARARILRDAENFAAAIQAIERFGRFLSPAGLTLAKYKDPIREFCDQAAMFEEMESSPERSFDRLYRRVQEARNESMHVGATARHAAFNTTTLLLLVEDALLKDSSEMHDFMVSEPVCSEMWQQVGLIRQKMLANSFSFLPVVPKSHGAWQLISDAALSVYLRSENVDRKRRLAMTLEQAVADGVNLTPAQSCLASAQLEDVLSKLDQRPVLLFDDAENSRLVGLVTAFDLL